MFKYNNLGPVYLYKYKRDEHNIIEQVGDLIVTGKRWNVYNKYEQYDRKAEIKIKNDAGKVMKIFVVSSLEGEVFNNMVWIHEPDIKKAAKILMKYEEDIIRDLNLKIGIHEEVRDYLYRMYGRNDAWKV